MDDKVLSMIEYVSECGCMVWTGTMNGPSPSYGKRRDSIRRVMFEYHIGIVPDDMMILNTCGNKYCVNPLHSRLVMHDHGKRILAATAARRETCRRGHPITYSKNGKKRYCRVCAAELAMKRRKERKSK